MAHETATLAAYVADLKFDDIPHDVLERAKILTLDFLGSAVRARRDAESTPSLLKMLEALALDGNGRSTVFGDARTWTPAIAALLNGALGHSLDFDDTHADSSLHPSAPVVPAAFAVGELVGASGRAVSAGANLSGPRAGGCGPAMLGVSGFFARPATPLVPPSIFPGVFPPG